MKRILIYIAFLSALVACSDDKVVDSANEITCTITTNNASRSAVDYSSTNKPDQFTLFAVTASDGKTFIVNNVLDITNKDGENSTGHYWPKPATDLIFTAWTGAQQKVGDTYSDIKTLGSDAIVSSGTTTKFNLAIDIPENADNQKDLIFATTKASSGVVHLSFKHALAQLSFQVENQVPSLYLDIKKIALCNIHNSASMTIGYLDADNNAGCDVTDVTDISKRTGTSYLEPATSLVAQCKPDKTYTTYTFSGGSGKSEYMYVMPHSSALGTDYKWSKTNTQGAYIEITCRLYNLSTTEVGTDGYYKFRGEDVESLVFGESSETNNHYKKMRIPIEPNWSASTGYKYTIKFNIDPANTNNVLDESGDNVDFVKVSLLATITDFVSGAESTQTITPHD